MLEQRKAEHLHINLEKDVSSPHLTTGLEYYRFVHNALPEIALDKVDLTTTFLGKRLRLPLLISSMTGGTAEAQRINLHLAEGAVELADSHEVFRTAQADKLVRFGGEFFHGAVGAHGKS